MHLVIGLGAIGGNIGAHFAELGQKVYGFDFNADSVRKWSEETKSPAGSDLAAVDWPSVDSVHIVVRLADQVSSVFASLQENTARPLTVFVHTTLAPIDARKIFSSAPGSWRAFEAPVSGGPHGARQGSMTIFLGGRHEPEFRFCHHERLAAAEGKAVNQEPTTLAKVSQTSHLQVFILALSIVARWIEGRL